MEAVFTQARDAGASAEEYLVEVGWRVEPTTVSRQLAVAIPPVCPVCA